MGGSQETTVRVNRKERVVGAMALQEHQLPLSNLDLLLPAVDVGVFFCYKSHPPAKQLTFEEMVHTLKRSLARALETYYAFAGEMVTNSAGEPELLCNNRGADFFEAYADVELGELRLYEPDVIVGRKMMPKKEGGVLCVQATELKCGGLVLACVFDHRIADAYSANMFFLAWAEIAVEKPMSLVPSSEKSLLNPRNPRRHDMSIDHLYMPASSLSSPCKNPNLAGDHAINRIYYITADDIERMQATASTGAGKKTKFESFSAYLWKIISKAAAPSAEVCRMGIFVDGRSRLSVDGIEGKTTTPPPPPLMGNYFGNVLSLSYGALSINDLEKMELSNVADVVHNDLQEVVTKEHFLGLIDWIEARRPEPVVGRLFCHVTKGENEGGEVGPVFVVSSGQRFPVSKVDFGWGRPVFGSYHYMGEGNHGYMMPMPSARGNGDWVVYIHLMRRHMEVLEVEAGEVFHRMTPDYLD